MPTAAEYFAQMCREAGLDETTTSGLAAIANNEKLSPKLNSLVKRATEDFDAQTGRVKAAEERVQKWNEWGTEAQRAVDQANAQYQAAQAELQRLAAGGDPAGFDASKYLTKEDLVKFNQEMGQRYAGVIKDATRIASRHVAKFGEEPDMDAIEALAAKEGLPLMAAYGKWIEPRVEVQRKESFEKEKKEYADQQVRDALSRHQLPVDSAPVSQSIMFKEAAANAPARSTDEELLATWNGAAAGKGKY